MRQNLLLGQLCRYLTLALIVGLITPVVHSQNYEVAENGLPQLSSLPGALSVAHLNFEGGNHSPPTGGYLGPYGGDLIFDSTEQAEIYNI